MVEPPPWDTVRTWITGLEYSPELKKSCQKSIITFYLSEEIFLFI